MSPLKLVKKQMTIVINERGMHGPTFSSDGRLCSLQKQVYELIDIPLENSGHGYTKSSTRSMKLGHFKYEHCYQSVARGIYATITFIVMPEP